MVLGVHTYVELLGVSSYDSKEDLIIWILKFTTLIHVSHVQYEYIKLIHLIISYIRLNKVILS
jgi:hypothetical protein